MFGENKGQGMVRQSPEKMEEESTSVFSPRFRSVAQMAGWDEETLLVASLVVEDTPDRQIKHKRRTDLHFKTPPPSNSRRYLHIPLLSFLFFFFFLQISEGLYIRCP